jgi:hypothetical protein
MTHTATRHWTTRRHLIVAAAVIVVAAWFAGQLSTALHGSSALAAPTTPTVPTSAPTTTVSIEGVPVGNVAADIAADVAVAVGPTSSPADPADTVGTVGTVGTLDALGVLAGIPVELEHHDGYDRDLFAVWIDADRDGCDTRDEVLAAENLNRVGGGCSATDGVWFSAFDNASAYDASTLDVDHVVSLKETFDSGAWAWNTDRRIAYGNDLTDGRTLVAVSAASNRAKGDRDPSNWIPDAGLCDYLGDWIAIKARWGLSMDESEHGRLGNLVHHDCPGLTIDAWPPTP